MKQTKRFLSVVLCLVMLLCAVSVMEASAVTFAQLNDESVFLKQAGSATCTLCSATMMLRRYSMLRGDSGWNTITESAVRPTAWIEGTGLRWSFTYSNSFVGGISVGHYTLPGGSANEAKIQEELTKCPEGIVIYNTSVPHAVLLTDYTDGVYYCADPLGSYPSGRIPLTSAYKVRITNVTAYWKVTSPVVMGPVDNPDTSGHDPMGCVDYCQGGIGYVWIRGWVFDPDDYNQTVNLHVYIGADSVAAGGEGHSDIYANQERPDVGKVYGCGNNHGYDNYITTDKTGVQDVYIYAINVGSGSTKLLAKETVTIESANPQGVLDICEGGEGYVNIRGWVFEPEDHAHTVEIHTYIGADSTAAGGEGHSGILANQEREDVDRVYQVGKNHGFDTRIKTSKTGNQTVYVYAINIGRGGTSLIGSKTVNITPHAHSYTPKVTAATCTADGVRAYTCSCGASYTEKINKLGHSFGAWTKLNDTQHQRVCSRDSSHVEKANHTWNVGTVTKAATCSATGVKTYTCSVCNGTKTETIPVNASNHVNRTNVAATASTCTVKGYSAGVYCNDCKKYISGHQEQPLATHQTETRNARAATCTAEGYTGDQYCTVCKQTISTGTTIGKKAHTLTTINQKTADCTTAGYSGDQYCTVCKQTISTGKTIDKKAHTLTTINQRAADCTTAGYTGDQYCTTCKQTITKGTSINALGHTSPDGNGNCTRCGAHIKDVTPTQPTQQQQQSGSCKYCGGIHSGPFGGLIQFFHSILAIFKR